MSLSNIKFPEENPFYRIKLRQIFLCLILVTVGLGFQLGIIGSIFKFDYNDPVFSTLLNILALILTGAWLLRQCKLVGINLNQLVGNIPNNYHWLPLIGLVITRVLFSIGAFRLSYYPLSFITPSFVENTLNYKISHNIFLLESKTFSPVLYYLLKIIYDFVVDPIFTILVFQGIVIHRWAAKWGIKAGILAICILAGFMSYTNVFGVMSEVLIYTLLYIKTRTLIVPIIAQILDSAIYNLIDVGFMSYRSYTGLSTLEQFRSEWKLGVLFLVLSAPWIIHFIYKNWPRSNEQLPYFANASNS